MEPIINTNNIIIRLDTNLFLFLSIVQELTKSDPEDWFLKGGRVHTATRSSITLMNDQTKENAHISWESKKEKDFKITAGGKQKTCKTIEELYKTSFYTPMKQWLLERFPRNTYFIKLLQKEKDDKFRGSISRFKS